MPKQRKTDEQRLKEGRGTGRGIHYRPWLKVHEFGSRGRAHRILGWKHKRVYQIMSDLEAYFFLIKQMDDSVVDIREQFPLLPLEHTLQIAEDENIIHPPKSRNKKTVMTTDFILTVKEGKQIKDVAFAIKYKKDLDEGPDDFSKKERIKDKLKIEELYWISKGIEWHLVTDEEISKTEGQNIYYIYNSFFWAERQGLALEEVRNLTDRFLNMLTVNNMDILQTTNKFDSDNSWETGESLNFFNFLLTRKVISTDFSKKFNYNSMKITINNDRMWKLG